MVEKQEAFSEPADPATNPPPESTNNAAGPLPLLVIFGIIIIAALALIAFVMSRAA